VEKSAVPFFDTDGNVCGFRGIDRDITERKCAEEELQNSYRKLEGTLDGVIQAMAQTVEIRDRHTAGHQRRVTELAHAIARELGLSGERSRAVRIAGLLHDLGKITIPTEILSKPGRLTDMEFAIIKTHPKAGYEILKSIEFPWPVADIVVQHHERIDGSGYPSGLKGNQSILEARILAVADVVEAMASHRPYRPALGIDRALSEIIGNRGRLYDPVVVDACLKVFNTGSFRFADQGV
jgi:putative nucleotidyltransferase with HDIG domain